MGMSVQLFFFVRDESPVPQCLSRKTWIRRGKAKRVRSARSARRKGRNDVVSSEGKEIKVNRELACEIHEELISNGYVKKGKLTEKYFN